MSKHKHVQEIKKGENLYSAGQHKAALAIFESVLRKDPNNVAALNDAGSAADEIGDSVRAVEYFEKALEIDNANECAFYNLIDLLAREEATDLAIEVYEKYQATIPNSREFRKYADVFRGYSGPAEAGTDVDDLSMEIRGNGRPRKHVIIVGQPRSGAAAFGQLLRQDSRLVCFDEPFWPHLRSFVEAAGDDHPGTLGEYINRRELVKKHWSMMQPHEEYYQDFIGHQEEYLRALLDEGGHVCINLTQCSAKIEAIRRLAPDALIVHIVRDPRSWVTSHLRPMGEWMPGLPDRFFTYDQGFDAWGRQTAAHAINAKGFAHEQLLQVWNHFVNHAESAMPDLTIRIEHLTFDPKGVLRAVYAQMELSYPEFDLSGVREPNAPHAPGDGRWSPALSRHVSSANRQFLFDYNSMPVAA